MIKILKKSELKRFWKKVDKSGDCWLWTAYKKKGGYGTFNVEGTMITAHRFSWQIHFGGIPEGMNVLHKCDTPACIRPEHLFLGTQQDNIDDMVEKGRQQKGEKHGNAKLDEEIVLCIRKYYPMFTQKKLGEFFNVGQNTISKVVLFQLWSHAN